MAQSDLVNRIKEHGYKIYIITGRKKNEKNDKYVEIKQRPDNNMIPYDKLIFEKNYKGCSLL